MEYRICSASVVPLRSGASHRSELASQLLFGELVEVLEKKGKQWVKVRCETDNFVAWVADNQLKPITPSEFDRYRKHFAFCLDLFQPILAQSYGIPITLGARLPDFDGIRFALENSVYTFSGQAVFPRDIRNPAEFILKIARKYLFAPHFQGGRSPLGIDSAGLIQLLYSLVNIPLPRLVEQQVFLGRPVDFIDQVRPGDVAFFENRQGRIIHCGLILSAQEVLHAYGSVRIDPLDHFGIYNSEAGRYTHFLRVVRRFLDDDALENIPSVVQQENNIRQVELF
ncbi:MAG TPA: NlpC/P60 family protein [Saprospiraceae bacterium]|nr:NlpC/P60 family protein [Saprospiraceae bacterium]HMQ85841.1 NlpC/P60 family protein [Saprospiraceae bacterium]